MTTISSEDSTTSTAPRIFHISDQVSTTSSDSPNVHRCPLCKKYRKFFFCSECIKSGLIMKHDEDMNHIHQCLEEMLEKRGNVERGCLKLLERKQKLDVLQTKIRQSRERNRIIRFAVEERKQKKQLLLKRLNELKVINKEHNEHHRFYKTKSEALEDLLPNELHKIATGRERFQQKTEQVKKLSRIVVQQLFKYVFPISDVKPTIEMESSGDNSCIKGLAEAAQTNYIKDKWVYTDCSNEMQYSIVAPCLPSSGNYSNYNLWAPKRDEISISQDIEIKMNPAWTISAALTYTTQLVSILSKVLDVRLPYRMIYSEFSFNLAETDFTRSVARLNANVLYLCVSQNIELGSLSPTGTIHNILQLRDNEGADLGRQGPIEIDEAQARALEKCIANELKSTEDSDLESDSFPPGWENVLGTGYPEYQPGPLNVQSSFINAQQASSVAGGLMNSAVASVASIWRGFTGGR